MDQIYIEDRAVPALVDHPQESASGLMSNLDHHPASVSRRLLSNLRGARAYCDDTSLIVRPAIIREGRSVVVHHRMPLGERALLAFGDRPPIEVGNGQTAFLVPQGITHIVLTHGNPGRHCEVTIRAFAAPRVKHLGWYSPLIVGQPATIGWRIENAARARLRIEQNDRVLFDSILSDHARDGKFLGLSGEQTVLFERVGNARVRVTAQSPGAPWRDLRRRDFPIMINPVFPAVPSFDELSVPRQAGVGDDIPIRWQLRGAAGMIMRWTDGDVERERALSPSGETVIVARSPGCMDLRFAAEPMFPADAAAGLPNSRQRAAGQPVSRRVEVRSRPPKIKVSQGKVRGVPLSFHDVSYEISGANEAWLVRPRRAQSVAIEPSGVMSFRIGKVTETITIFARSMAGDETSAKISLIPRKGFFWRLFNVTF